MFSRVLIRVGLLSLGLLLSDTSFATTQVTSSFNVSLTINAECKIISASDLTFGSATLITTNIDTTGSIAVQCTAGTPFTLGLSAGNGANVAARRMNGLTGATLNYSLYSNAARTLNWGDITDILTNSGIGTGASQPFTVYGRVPVQTATPGAYTDRITVTLSY